MDVDVGMLFRRRNQDFFHRPARHVPGMNDAVPTVSSFPSQVEMCGLRPCGSEINPPGGELPYSIGSRFHHHFHHIGMAKAGPGIEGVLDMELEGVVLSQNGCDPTLGVIGAGFQLVFLGHHGNASTICRFQGEGQPCDPASNHEKIIMVFHDATVRMLAP